jgi:hypothetical protein
MSHEALRLRVGPGPHGEWIVNDEAGVCGAICANREEALRFAKAECKAGPQSSEWRIVDKVDLTPWFAGSRRD